MEGRGRAEGVIADSREAVVVGGEGHLQVGDGRGCCGNAVIVKVTLPPPCAGQGGEEVGGAPS